MIKLFICLLIFLCLGIFGKSNVNYREFIRKKIYHERISFSAIEKIYNRYLGGIFPIEFNYTNDNVSEVFNEKLSYQKIDDYYYKKEETDNILVAKEEIYDLISSEYIELNNLLTYINTASLDHVTNYSSGKKEFGYNLYIKDIVMNNQTNDVVNIKVIEENETLTIMADYSNLIKETNATIKECKVEYIFNNINKVDENADKLETSGDTNE